MANRRLAAVMPQYVLLVSDSIDLAGIVRYICAMGYDLAPTERATLERPPRQSELAKERLSGSSGLLPPE